MVELPAFTHALCDDAAMFPDGTGSAPDALTQHRNHRAAGYSGLVGPLVLDAAALTDLSPLLTSDECLQLTITAPRGPEQLTEAMRTATSLPWSSPLPRSPCPATAEFFIELRRAAPLGVRVFVELPATSGAPTSSPGAPSMNTGRSSAPAGCVLSCVPTRRSWPGR